MRAKTWETMMLGIRLGDTDVEGGADLGAALQCLFIYFFSLFVFAHFPHFKHSFLFIYIDYFAPRATLSLWFFRDGRERDGAICGFSWCRIAG